MNRVYLKDFRKLPWRIVEAELVELDRVGLDKTDAYWERSREYWREILAGTYGQEPPESDDWEWSRKPSTLEEGEGQVLAVRCEGDVQGLMLLNRRSQSCRSTSASSTGCCLYVEYLEAAPWNQKGYAGVHVRYGGIGSALIYAAVQLSKMVGCWGALGLHALPGAEGFYRYLGFEDLGVDAVEGMHYFELGEKAAIMLLAEADDEDS